MKRAIERLVFAVLVGLLLAWCVLVSVMPGMIDSETTPAAFGRFGITRE